MYETETCFSVLNERKKLKITIWLENRGNSEPSWGYSEQAHFSQMNSLGPLEPIQKFWFHVLHPGPDPSAFARKYATFTRDGGRTIGSYYC